jgi:hypothetical protein
MRAMSVYPFAALCAQPAGAGMRAMPQGVLGGAHARAMATAAHATQVRPRRSTRR